MRRITFAALCGLTQLLMALGTRPSFGDVLLLESNTWKAHRFTDAGAFRQTYFPAHIPVENCCGYTVDSASQFVYALSFSIGNGEAWPMSAQTGGLAGHFVGGNFVQTGGVNLPPIVQPSSYRFHINTMTGGEEVFVGAHTLDRGPDGGTAPATIERFSGIDGSLIQSIPMSDPQASVSDIVFGANDRLFVATNGGVVAFTKQAGGVAGLYGPPSGAGTLLVPGGYGEIAVGADGAVLYQSSFGMPINRFDSTTGAPLGKLVAPADVGGNQIVAFEVGNDGTLFVAHRSGDPSNFVYSLSKFNSVTGNLLSTVPLTNVAGGGNSLVGDLYILPVPEPATATLAAAVVLIGACFARRVNQAAC